LQRLELYEGIILITTNAANRIDQAFQRRLDLTIEFRQPDAEQRQRLWQLHLPSNHAVSSAFLNQVSLRCALSGGQIRNATLQAAVLATETQTPITDPCLAAGIQQEYTKMGASAPLQERFAAPTYASSLP
jgi:ATP-dependent 26S proteasome regulatory subunit